MLKILSNSYFLLILLDGKKKGDRCSFGGNRRTKVEKTSSENVFLIILLYWPNLHLSRISIGVCKDSHIEKSRGNNFGLGKGKVDRDGGVNNLYTGIDIAGTDKKAKNLSISIDTPNPDNINDIDKRVNNLGIGKDKADADKKINNLCIGIDIIDINADKRADLGINIDTAETDIGKKAKLGISTDIAEVDADRKADNLKIRIIDTHRQVTTSNKAHLSFFSLYKVFFDSSSKLKTVFTFSLSSFIFLLFSVTLMK